MQINGLVSIWWRRCGVFSVTFEQISHIALVFPLLAWNKYILAGIFSSKYRGCNFEQYSMRWEAALKYVHDIFDKSLESV